MSVMAQNCRYIYHTLFGKTKIQDILLYHNLALATSRTYVYQPFVWRPRGEKSYVPLSAFLPGVTKDSVSVEVLEKYCREEELHHVTLGHEEQWKHAIDTLNGNQRCVVVDDWIFNWRCVVLPFIFRYHCRQTSEFYLGFWQALDYILYGHLSVNI